MLLSVYMPHSGLDEEDYIEALEVVRTTLVEGKKAGAVDICTDWTVSNGMVCMDPNAEVEARTSPLTRKRSGGYNC